MKEIRNYSALLLIIFLVAALPAAASADTYVSGIISGDTTWTQSGSPYIVTGNILVNNGVTLTIEPGVTVKFDSGTGLQVDGTLIARGTDTDNIIFTSNQPSPAPGDWGYIFFTDTSTDAAYDEGGNYTGGSILEYCVIEYAGGASLTDNGALRMDNAHPFINYCTIRSNSAAGINAYNLSAMIKITNSTVSDNAASSDSGGIAVSGGTAVISGNNILSNTRSVGSGGGIAAYNSTASISGNTVSGNSAHISGGGIFVNGGTVDISGNTISGNSAYRGSGIAASGSTAVITVSGNTITGNTSGSGGGISITYGTVTVSGNTISDNTSTETPSIGNDGIAGGGGMLIEGAIVTVSGNTIDNNTAEASGGGIYAVYSAYGSTTTISGNTISNNTSGGFGGGISISYSATAVISANTIIGNTSNLYGGGIAVNYNSTITAADNTITGNSAENASAVYYSSNTAGQDFRNNTITGNTATGATATGAAPTYTVFIEGYPLFNYNDIFNNTADYELWNNNEAGTPDVDATNNWWGTAVETEIQAKIYDWFDDSSKGVVDYYPYLGGPVGEVADISAEPAAWDFGNVNAGSVSASRTFTVSNKGRADLVIGRVYLGGVNPYQFSIVSEDCSNRRIAPSGSCIIEARYEPTRTGAMKAAIVIDSNDPDTPSLSIELRGTGILQKFTIKAVAGANGGISPSGAVSVYYGEDKTFTIIPAAGYKAGDVLVDDVSVGPVTTYTFTNIKADHTIVATFCKGRSKSNRGGRK